jgi:FCD domain
MSGRCDCHLSPADFDHAYDLAKRLTRSNNAKEHFEYNRHFWDSIFSKTKRPILREVLHQLEDRGTRYERFCLSFFRQKPDRASERYSSKCIAKERLPRRFEPLKRST